MYSSQVTDLFPNGALEDGREEQCSLVEIKLPFGETQKIKRFRAQTLKNYVETDDG